MCTCISSFSGDDLKEIFCRYGTVRDVYIPVDYHTREARGFCYVEYPYTLEVKYYSSIVQISNPVTHRRTCIYTWLYVRSDYTFLCSRCYNV